MPPQRFTGQRLDSTGLYYYGARYYDPTIGRFISPDTIVQDPANPQSFNRYSYCLNNPLKYVDPTGNNVNIYGIDPTKLGDLTPGQMLAIMADENTAPLLMAWLELEKAVPKLASDIENDPATITISWSNSLPLLTGGQTDSKFQSTDSGVTWTFHSSTVLVNTAFKNHLGLTAKTLAHESFHVIRDINTIDTIVPNTRLEEVYAFSIGFAVENIISPSWSNGFWESAKGVLPTWSDDKVYAYTGGINGWRYMFTNYWSMDRVPEDRSLLKQLYVKYHPD